MMIIISTPWHISLIFLLFCPIHRHFWNACAPELLAPPHPGLWSRVSLTGFLTFIGADGVWLEAWPGLHGPFSSFAWGWLVWMVRTGGLFLCFMVFWFLKMKQVKKPVQQECLLQAGRSLPVSSCWRICLWACLFSLPWYVITLTRFQDKSHSVSRSDY